MARKFNGLGSGKRYDVGFGVDVRIGRNVGASDAGAFYSQACVTKRGSRRRTNYAVNRCGTGVGRNPTAAAKKALASLARNLKRRG